MAPARRPESIAGPVRGSVRSPLEGRVTGWGTGAAGAGGIPPLGPRSPAAPAGGPGGTSGPPSGGTGPGLVVATGGLVVLVVLVELLELVELVEPVELVELLEVVEPAECSEVVVEVEWWWGPVDVVVLRLVGSEGALGSGDETPDPSTVTTRTLPLTAAAPPMHRRNSIGFLPARRRPLVPSRRDSKSSHPHPSSSLNRRVELVASYTH